MTTMTGSASGAPAPTRTAPSPAEMRARRLLAGGLIGAHLAAIGGVGVFLAREGLPGAASAALGAALVLLFYTAGQAVQVRFADAPATTVFRASVVSYIVRVTALGGVFALYLSMGEASARLRPVPLGATAIASVVGWLAGEILTFSRLRIPNFDDPSDGGG